MYNVLSVILDPDNYNLPSLVVHQTVVYYVNVTIDCTGERINLHETVVRVTTDYHI